MEILIGAYCLKQVSYKKCTNQNFHICQPSKVLLGRKKNRKKLVEHWSLKQMVITSIFEEVFTSAI